MVPLCDVQQQYTSLKSEIDAAIELVCLDGTYILGPNVRAFEREMADYATCDHAIGVGSGTDALQLALRSLSIGPGDEVITSPFTFIATSEAISLVGATPVFVDVQPRTFNIDPSQIESAITSRTRAIIPIHMFGLPCDMATIMDIARGHDIRVVEDCAQSLGATYGGQKVGTIGDVGCLSFFPSKNLGCFGDGGMALTNNSEIADRIEMLRRHGGKVKYHHSEVGLNSRLDEIQAAVLRVKLGHLDDWNDSRQACARYYQNVLAAITGIDLPLHSIATPKGTQQAKAESVFHQYTIKVDDREEIRQQLSASEVATAIYYPVPLHLQAAYSSLSLGKGAFPNAERAANRCLSIPMFPGISRQQQDLVVDSLRRAFDTSSESQAA